MVAPSSSTSTSLKEYLKKYDANYEQEKKKKKKKKKVKPDTTGVIVVDEDPIWQKPVRLEEQEDDSEDEEKPLVDEDIDVKRMKRLEQLRSKRPFGAISEDGSGWVSISDYPKKLSSHGEIVDLSPSYKQKARNDTPSPEPELKQSRTAEADLSPPRRSRARNDTPSPERGQRKSTMKDADLSPPRKRSARNDTPSPELKPRPSNADKEDLSPPRKCSSRNDTPSPEAKLRPSSALSADMSPPRRRKAYQSPSPDPIKKLPLALDSDISPPHQTDRGKSSEMADISPPRRVRPRFKDSRFSPTADISPPRKSRDKSDSVAISSRQSGRTRADDAVVVSSRSDLSPPRKSRGKSPLLKEQPKTGLVTGHDIKEEIAKTKKNEWLRFKDMDPSLSGRDAEPVYRDKITGKRISKEEVLKSQKKKEEKPKEIKLEWGKGLAQKREMEAKLEELEREKEKPFARSRDDPELDRVLKERVRWGDPMAHLVKRKQSEAALPDLGASEKMKESGFVVPQDIPSHSWIRRGLDASPNRYGIRPGRHWDGVDRSNGFEKELFKRMNEKQATQREAYLWSVSDM